VWDDHEVANNGYRDGFSNMNNTEESFLEFGGVSVDQRKMNAVRAYFEYQPIRQVAMDDNLRIWRNFKLGKMVDLIMLDTRNYDRSITTLDGNDGESAHEAFHSFIKFLTFSFFKYISINGLSLSSRAQSSCT
jgi:phosphodiesterase/alkaline phosphatase D-like protein